MDRTVTLDQETWRRTRSAIHRAVRQAGRPARKCTYSDELILAMYLWGVWRGEGLSWSCRRENYGALFRPRRLPSVSQFSRRVKTDRFQSLLQRVHEILAAEPQPLERGYLDGKPLTVSPVSKDPDAARGRVSGGFAKGYKLHAAVTAGRRIPVWSVTPLSAAEQSVALELCPHLPMLGADCVFLADANFDSAPLHKTLNARGAALLTPLKNQDRVKGGRHHAVTLRQMGPARRELVGLWREGPRALRDALKDRINIEGVFSVLTVALDLRLPAAVRRLRRVRRFVGGKIILYHARLLAQEALAA
jgi:hypothetical protein